MKTGRLKDQDKIGLTVGHIINRYKMAKHFMLTITDTTFAFVRKPEAIAAEAALDEIYIIRTSVTAEHLDAASCVRHTKSLSQVERAFRSLKTIDLKIRAIHDGSVDRVRAHIFLCLFAYYAEGVCATPGGNSSSPTRVKRPRACDPVAPAIRSAEVQAKVARRCHADGTPIHTFQTLLADIATIVRNTCQTSTEDNAPPFPVTTQPTPLQQRAWGLIAIAPA